MDIGEETTVTPPKDETEYTVKIIDYGQGNKQLSIAPTGERPAYTFTIINEQLQECQWRDEDESVPTPILKAVEYYGYHVTDVTERPKHGLYENVQYLHETVEEIGTELSEVNLIGRSGVTWASESLAALSKLELLRAHLTDAEFDIVLFKAYETSQDHPSGNLDIPTTNGVTNASLKSIVTLMIAYAQHDGYLNQEMLDPDVVENLVRRSENA